MVTKGAGYMHPKCVVSYVEANGLDKDDLVEGVRANSRLVPADLEGAIAEIG
jgi:hypothetical protein